MVTSMRYVSVLSMILAHQKQVSEKSNTIILSSDEVNKTRNHQKTKKRCHGDGSCWADHPPEHLLIHKRWRHVC